MDITAKAKNIRMSPKKIRLVTDLIKGLDVVEALEQLTFSKKHAAEPVMKLLKSGIANAVENYSLDKNNLLIKEIRVDEGVTLKRWAPKARGRATPLRKRSSHIILILTEKVPTDVKDVKKKEKKTDDIVKIEDLGKVKPEADVDDFNAHEHRQDKSSKPVKSNKGFMGKVFTRKSGEK